MSAEDDAGLASELPIALVGLRCAGKTTVGRALAERLRWSFVDLDEELVERAEARAATAGELLRSVGELEFRAREQIALRQVLERPGHFVLATGGGVVESADNRNLLSARTRVVWLRADPVVLQHRLAKDPAFRPALLGGADAAAELVELARRRDALYAEIATSSVDTTSAPPDLVARRILESLTRGD